MVRASMSNTNMQSVLHNKLRPEQFSRTAIKRRTCQYLKIFSQATKDVTVE
jgi:hypothetical protein